MSVEDPLASDLREALRSLSEDTPSNDLARASILAAVAGSPLEAVALEEIDRPARTTERAALIETLATHVWWPGTPNDGPGCYCGWRCPVAKGTSRHDLHAEHVADVILEDQP